MIQRKQTLWLALIALICFSSVAINIPFREVQGQLEGNMIEDAFVRIGFSYTTLEIAKVRERTQPNTLLKYATLLLGLNCLAAILFFKNRSRQKFLIQIGFGLILILCILMYYYGWGKRYVDYKPDSQIIISILFPFLFFWLNYKALKGVQRDEDLVKSYDRLR